MATTPTPQRYQVGQTVNILVDWLTTRPATIIAVRVQQKRLKGIDRMASYREYGCKDGDGVVHWVSEMALDQHNTAQA